MTKNARRPPIRSLSRPSTQQSSGGAIVSIHRALTKSLSFSNAQGCRRAISRQGRYEFVAEDNDRP
jgi:hypothetical protein